MYENYIKLRKQDLSLLHDNIIGSFIDMLPVQSRAQKLQIMEGLISLHIDAYNAQEMFTSVYVIGRITKKEFWHFILTGKVSGE